MGVLCPETRSKLIQSFQFQQVLAIIGLSLAHIGAIMYTLLRTDSFHPAFQELVRSLDQSLAITDGEDHAFYNQFNQLDKIRHVILAYNEETAVGCGALRELEPGKVEVKRMYVSEGMRRKGVAKAVLAELELWAREMGYGACVLETGLRQYEAIQLYQRSGYQVIPNFGPYIGVENSVCFAKSL
jgi:putative acetyltransferase